MIYNRTQEDIDKAKEIIEDKIKIRYHEDSESYAPNNTEPLTDEEKAVLERAIFDRKAIERVEEAMENLKGKLRNNGYDLSMKTFNGDEYSLSDIETKTFSTDDWFERSDFERWINNIEIIKNIFHTVPYYVSKNDNFTHYETLNEIEGAIESFNDYLDGMIESKRICGITICGGEFSW